MPSKSSAHLTTLVRSGNTARIPPVRGLAGGGIGASGKSPRHESHVSKHPAAGIIIEMGGMTRMWRLQIMSKQSALGRRGYSWGHIGI